MYDIFFMDVLKASDEAGDKELCGLLIKSAVLANVVSEVTAREVVHHEVEIFTILEGVVHIDDEQVV